MTHYKCAPSHAPLVACLLLGACTSVDHQSRSGHEASPFSIERSLVRETNDSSYTRESSTYPSDPARYYLSLQTAREHVRNEDCESAVALLEHAVQQYADDGAVWGLLGACRAKLKTWEKAVEAFEVALELGVRPWDLDLDLNPNDIMVKIAGIYAQAGDTDRALAWLRRGFEARYDERPDLLDAPEFASLSDHAEFAALVGRPELEAPSRDEQWRRDIAFLREQVAMLHFDPDHHTAAAELERTLSDLARDVPKLRDE